MTVFRTIAVLLSLGVQSSAFSPFARALGRPTLATRAAPVAATHGTSDDSGGGVSRRGVLGAAAGVLAGAGLVPMGPARADIDLKAQLSGLSCESSNSIKGSANCAANFDKPPPAGILDSLSTSAKSRAEIAALPKTNSEMSIGANRMSEFDPTAASRTNVGAVGPSPAPAPAPAPAPPPPAAPAAKDPWRQVASEGQTFWYNEKSGESAWDHP